MGKARLGLVRWALLTWRNYIGTIGKQERKTKKDIISRFDEQNQQYPDGIKITDYNLLFQDVYYHHISNALQSAMRS